MVTKYFMRRFLLLSLQGMEELPDYNKITFPENPPIPFEEVVPDASPEVENPLKGLGTFVQHKTYTI